MLIGDNVRKDSFVSRVLEFNKTPFVIPETLLIHVEEETGAIFATEYGPAGGYLTHDEFYELMDKMLLFYDNHSPEEIAQLNQDLLQSRKAKLAEERNTPPKTSYKSSGYIYLLKADNGFYKIGKARDVKSRFNLLSIQLPFQVELLHSFPTNDTTRAERDLHQLFASKRANGEWFSLDQEDVEAILNITEIYF